jgi:prepilin-type N-terminal cleavage/methylation domain-containing protein
MRRAFTIIEVLAALAIFAGAAVALTTAYLSVLNSYAHVRTVMAEDEDMKLARAALFSQTDPTLATQGDDFDVIDGSNRRHVKWTADIEATKVADLFDVTLICEVTPQGGETTSTSESIRLLRPTWSTDAGTRTQLQNDARQAITAIITAKQSQ